MLKERRFCAIAMEKVKKSSNTIIHYELSTVINADNRWLYLNIQSDDIHQWKEDMTPNLIGIFYQQGNLPSEEKYRFKLETYEKPVIGILNDPHVFITPMNLGEEIGSKSNWATPTNGWPDLPTLYGTTYKEWEGAIKYVGFQIIAIGSIKKILYGWVKLDISPSGDSATVLGVAYNKSGVSIKAGQIIA